MLEHVVDDARFRGASWPASRGRAAAWSSTRRISSTARCGALRHALGQTDEKHGHRRPGYTADGLRALLGPAFELESHHTYSRFFSELVDTGINAGLGALGKRSSAKGMVVTGDDVGRHRRLFRAYGAVYPAVWLVSRLDALVPASGYMLIATARRRG